MREGLHVDGDAEEGGVDGQAGEDVEQQTQAAGDEEEVCKAN